MADERGWYPEDWHSAEGDPLELPGVRVVIEGGPLHARTAHVLDRDSSLWVARERSGRVIVTDGTEPPELPDDASLLGRYRFDANREALIWRPL